MKKENKSGFNNPARYVRIDPYTWIEKRINETDEAARQRFLDKLARAVENPKLQFGFNT